MRELDLDEAAGDRDEFDALVDDARRRGFLGREAEDVRPEAGLRVVVSRPQPPPRLALVA